MKVKEQLMRLGRNEMWGNVLRECLGTSRGCEEAD